jgi:hypothetical protein
MSEMRGAGDIWTSPPVEFDVELDGYIDSFLTAHRL